jgi:integrase
MAQLMGQKAKKIRGIFERPRGSGVWWVRYVDQYGKEHREKVGMKSAAVTVSKLLGHTDIKMTMRYSHLAPEYMKSAVGTLDSNRTGTEAGTDDSGRSGGAF